MRKILVINNRIGQYLTRKSIIEQIIKYGYKIKAIDKGSITLEDGTIFSIKEYNEKRLSDLLRSKYNIKEREVFYYSWGVSKYSGDNLYEEFLSSYLNQNVTPIAYISDMFLILENKKKYGNIENFWTISSTELRPIKISLIYSLDKPNVYLTKEEAEKALVEYMTNKIKTNNEEIQVLKDKTNEIEDFNKKLEEKLSLYTSN